ncbi:MAG: hypothetical protein ACRDN0_16255 [Trebonia sp.]
MSLGAPGPDAGADAGSRDRSGERSLYSASRGRTPSRTSAARRAAAAAGSAASQMPPSSPAETAAVKAFWLTAMTDDSAALYRLNAQSDWPGAVPMSNATAAARFVLAVARSSRS